MAACTDCVIVDFEWSLWIIGGITFWRDHFLEGLQFWQVDFVVLGRTLGVCMGSNYGN